MKNIILLIILVSGIILLGSCKKEKIEPTPTTPTPIGDKLEVFYELHPNNLADTAYMSVFLDAGYYNTDSVGVTEYFNQYGQGHGKFVFTNISDEVDASFYIMTDGSTTNSVHIVVTEVKLNGNTVSNYTSNPAIGNDHLFIITPDMW